MLESEIYQVRIIFRNLDKERNEVLQIATLNGCSVYKVEKNIEQSTYYFNCKEEAESFRSSVDRERIGRQSWIGEYQHQT